MDLQAAEIRVLGCLLEKQRATPDAYPLTLNSLRLACNQSTNREPVVQYSDAEVREAAQRLERHGLVRFASGAGSRAAKFRHLLAERLPMDDAEQAVMCVLMLRGAQTPGELKQRGERLHSFLDLAEVEDTLQRLIERSLVVCVPRRPGQKEERYEHRLGTDEDAAPVAPGERTQPTAPAAPGQWVQPNANEPVAAPHAPTAAMTEPEPHHAAPVAQASALEAELRRLRDRVQRLEREMQSLKTELGIEVGPGAGVTP